MYIRGSVYTSNESNVSTGSLALAVVLVVDRFRIGPHLRGPAAAGAVAEVGRFVVELVVAGRAADVVDLVLRLRGVARVLVLPPGRPDLLFVQRGIAAAVIS